MVQKHVEFLTQIGDGGPGYTGNNSLKWANFVMPSRPFDSSLNRRFNRHELFDYCKNSNNDNLHVLVAILSWGGMRRDHGKLLFKNLDKVLEIVDDLRNLKYDNRIIAFETIQNLRRERLLPGLGIGYFTKLICFLSPKLNGYIMDQWVGKSINLLTRQNVVNLSNNSWVNDTNSSTSYESFCNHVDQLAVRLGCTGYDAEERIFSVGRGKGVWRNYLIKNYNKTSEKI